MENKYALFFDIDGTLVSFKTHEIPSSTVFALTQAKARGHKVFIATGRPPLIITNLGAIEHLIDGYVFDVISAQKLNDAVKEAAKAAGLNWIITEVITSEQSVRRLQMSSVTSYPITTHVGRLFRALFRWVFRLKLL